MFVATAKSSAEEAGGVSDLDRRDEGVVRNRGLHVRRKFGRGIASYDELGDFGRLVVDARRRPKPLPPRSARFPGAPRQMNSSLTWISDGAADGLSAMTEIVESMTAGCSSATFGATSMLPLCGKGRSRVNAHFTAGMRRSNDISLESTGSCPRGTQLEAIADSPAMQKLPRSSHRCQCRWDQLQNIHASADVTFIRNAWRGYSSRSGTRIGGPRPCSSLCGRADVPKQRCERADAPGTIRGETGAELGPRRKDAKIMPRGAQEAALFRPWML